MKIRNILSLVLAISMLFATTACTKKDDAGTATKVKVNDTVITVSEFDDTFAQYKAMYEKQYGEDYFTDKTLGKTREEELKEQVLDSMILEIVLIDRAKADNVEITDEELETELSSFKSYFDSTDEYEQYLSQNNMTEDFVKETLKKELLVTKYLQQESAFIDELEPTEEELKQLFEDKKDLFVKVRASHILVDTKEEAEEIKKQLDEGANFEDLAKEKSTCPSGTEGGDLDYFTYNDMISEFSEVAFNMEIGKISEPVQSSFGWHIIKVTDKQDTFETVDQDELIYQYKAMKYNEMLDKFIEDAKIEK